VSATGHETAGQHSQPTLFGRFVPVWVPDAVTLTRIALTPIFLFTAEAARSAGQAGLPAGTLRTTAVVLLVTIALSDKLDGYLARRTGHPTTRRGAFLDAAADRLAQWSGAWYMALRAWPVFTALPLWFPLILLARDAVLLAVFFRRKGTREVSLEHDMHGKTSTVLVFLLLIGATAGAPPLVVTAGSALAGAAVLYSTARYAARLRASE